MDQVDHPGSESEWVSVADLPSQQLAKYPWSLSGGGAKELVALIEKKATRLRARISPPVGRGFRVGADEAYLRPLRWETSSPDLKPLLLGEVVRNWTAQPNDAILFPYSTDADLVRLQRELWPWRHQLAERSTFQGNMADADLQWWDYMQFTVSAYAWPLSICFSFVASHNNFTLVRGGSVFNRSAPVIKLPEGETEDQHVTLLGVLNSSAACFWLKQVSQKKGGANNSGGGRADQPWSWSYEFTGKKLEEFPLPAKLSGEFGRQLDSLAQQLVRVEPSDICANGVPGHERLGTARTEYGRIRGRMIALQEELDWDVYHRYGLLTDQEAAELVAAPESVPNLKLGERAFEIVLARRMRDGGFETQWFERHRSTPITEVPAHWPDEYKAVVERRIEIITANRNIGLIERPECKRRWQSEPWEDKERKALTDWLLDRCEERDLWLRDGQPQPLTVNRLADLLRKDADVVSVARLLKNDPDADLAKVLTEIIADEHVPYLAQLRYTGEGLLKRTQWEDTWDLQREEDATGERLDIPVPPKYKNTDFQKPSYWRNRGKLDVPKERFISYPKAGPDSDNSLLLGWAGWDHKEQAQALYGLIEERQNVDGWGTDRVTPLILGLAEVMPWVRQWHDEVDPAFGQSIADVLDGYLAAQRERHGITG